MRKDEIVRNHLRVLNEQFFLTFTASTGRPRQFSFLHVKYLKSLKAENYIFSKFKEICGLKTASFNSFGSLELRNTVRDFFVIV